MPQRATMAYAMGSMSACIRIMKTGVVAPVSLFVLVLVSVVVRSLVGLLSLVSLISILVLTGLTRLVGLVSLVRLKEMLATGTAMGD